MPVKTVTKKKKLELQLASSSIFQDKIVIKQSSIEGMEGSGFGVFYEGDEGIPSGRFLGYYKGQNIGEAECAKSDYAFNTPQKGVFRDASDMEGRLLTSTGILLDMNNLAVDLDMSEVRGVGGESWKGEHSNWTRFMNHSSIGNVRVMQRSTELYGARYVPSIYIYISLYLYILFITLNTHIP